MPCASVRPVSVWPSPSCDGGLGAFLVVHDEVDGEPRAVGPFRIGRVGAVADEIAARPVGHARSPDQGMRMVKGCDRHELLVARGAGAPHEDGEAAGLVEHGQAVMPGVGLVGDALLAGGDEGAHARDVGAAAARRAAPPRSASAPTSIGTKVCEENSWRSSSSARAAGRASSAFRLSDRLGRRLGAQVAERVLVIVAAGARSACRSRRR